MRRKLRHQPLRHLAMSCDWLAVRDRLRSAWLSEEIEQRWFILSKRKDRRPTACRPFRYRPNRTEDELSDCASVLRSGVAPGLEVSCDDRVRRRSVVTSRRDHLIQDFDRRLEPRGGSHWPPLPLVGAAIVLPSRIVRRLAGDRDVVDMAFRQARARDADETRALLQVLDGLRARVAHRRLHTPDQLVDDLAYRPLVWDLSLDAFRNELQLVADVLLEISVRRSAGHGPDRAHATIALVGTTLVQECFPGSFLRTREQRSDHDRRSAGRERLRDVAAGADAAVGNHRHARLRRHLGGLHDGGELRDPDAGDDSGRADRSGSDTHLDRVRTRIDERACSVA